MSTHLSHPIRSLLATLLVAAPAVAAPTTIDPLLERTGTSARIEVDARSGIAEFEIEEHFRNNTEQIIEAEYVFPIPRGALFRNLSLYSGETELRGEVLRAEDANAIYEDIVRRIKDPALIELAGRDLIRARIFPVAPGETRRIVLRFSQVLATAGDAYRLNHTARAGLLSPRQFAVPDVRRAALPQLAGRGRSLTIPMRVSITNAEAVGAPYSPTHDVEVRRRGGRMLVNLSLRTMSDDLELFLPLVDGGVSATLVTHAERESDGHFLLMLRPPLERATTVTPRELTIVVDTSGSMAGDKLEQARAAIGRMLEGLTHQDRFNVVNFSSATRALFAQPAPATRSNLARAAHFLRDLEADGGTDIEGALRRALDTAADPQRLGLTVLITDGLPTNGEQDPAALVRIANARRGERRLFTLGLGHDVNSFLLEQLPSGSRGAAEFLQPGARVDLAIDSLSRRLQSPVWTDLEIVSAPVLLEDLVPRELPDLYLDDDLVLTGRYRGNASGDLVIRGMNRGVPVEHRFVVSFDNDASAPFASRLWASRKAAQLATDIRLRGHSAELVEEIRQLGLRYGVLTEFTAYLVQEPGAVTDAAGVRERTESMVLAPTEQAGDAAVSGAARRGQQQRASSLAESEWSYDGAEIMDMAFMSAQPVYFDFDAFESPGAPVAVGNRLFVARPDGWVELGADPATPCIEVAPLGTTWFRIAAEFPGLAPALGLGDTVIIAGEGARLCVTPGAADELDAATWNRVTVVLDGQSAGAK